MKTNRISRLLAAVLAMLMLLSSFSAAAANEAEVSSADYEAWTAETVQKYYELLVCADGYVSATTYQQLLSDGQYEEVYSRLTDAQKKIVDGVIADMYTGYLYEPALNRTNAAPLREGPVVMQPKVRLMTAAKEGTQISFGSEYTYDNGMYLNKEVKSNNEGTYTLTLEAFLAGTVSATPSDIVLVLDDSGSMTTKMGLNPVYDLDKSKEYYVAFNNNSDGMRRVKWTKKTMVPTAEGASTTVTLDEEAWALQEVMGSSMLHTRQQTYQPKTSANDTASDHWQFYEKCVTRKEALESAVRVFLDAVKKDEEDKFPVGGQTGHRVSIIKFAAKNTQKVLLNWTSPRNFSSDQDFGLQANGGTYIHQGLELAITQMEALTTPNPANQERHKVVIVFTDGYPGGGDWGEKSAHESAKLAINYANTLKQTHKATVYSVGIFAGANPNERYGGTLHQKNAGTCTTVGSNDASSGHGVSNEGLANTMMNAISSCYPNAKAEYNTENVCPNVASTLQFYLNRPQADYKDGYYLSANDADALQDIFKNISSSIQKPVTYDIDDDTMVVDQLSQYFELVVGADGANQIRTYTAPYQGNQTWGDRNSINATVNVEEETKKVSVNGFHFQDNFVAEDPRENGSRGSKLIIEIDIRPEGEFLGGNAVLTNSRAYVRLDGVDIASKFPTPVADVSTLDISVTAEPRNVYLYDVLTDEELVPMPRMISYKDRYTNETHTLDVDANGECWQNDYVVIEDTVVATEGPLAEDTKYTFTVTMEPEKDPVSTDGSNANDATEKTASAEADIHVYKPYLTFKDTSVYYGETQPDYPTADYVETEWKHGDTLDTNVTMMGTKPEITLNYTPEASKISDGKINTKQDIYVNVMAAVEGAPSGTTENANITFVHQACDPACEFAAENGEFLLHVKTCELTVQKNGGNADEPYVIIVKKDGADYTELTLNGNSEATIKELPIGTYSIREETNWSWRFNPSYSAGVTLSSTNPSGTVTCTNTANSLNKWLNDYDGAVVNTQGVSNYD